MKLNIYAIHVIKCLINKDKITLNGEMNPIDVLESMSTFTDEISAEITGIIKEGISNVSEKEKKVSKKQKKTVVQTIVENHNAENGVENSTPVEGAEPVVANGDAKPKRKYTRKPKVAAEPENKEESNTDTEKKEEPKPEPKKKEPKKKAEPKKKEEAKVEQKDESKPETENKETKKKEPKKKAEPKKKEEPKVENLATKIVEAGLNKQPVAEPEIKVKEEPVPVEEDDEDTEVVEGRVITYNNTEYVLDDNNNVYDMKTTEIVGKYDGTNSSIEFL